MYVEKRTKHQIIKMWKLTVFITAVCDLVLIKLAQSVIADNNMLKECRAMNLLGETSSMLGSPWVAPHAANLNRI